MPAATKEKENIHIPAASPPQNALEDYHKQCEDYLTKRGWKKIVMNNRNLWSDPMGVSRPKGKLVHEGTLPAAGGGTEVLSQWHGPPCPWTYTLEQAFSLQRGRDGSLEGIQAQINRKREEIADLEEEFLKLEYAKEAKK